MAATFTDVINAMIEADKRDLDVEKVVLTDESMGSFLADDMFTKETEKRQKETIGTDWGVRVESGSNDVLVAGGEEIPL